MRFYVHYEGEPPFTYIVRWDSNNHGTFADLKKVLASLETIAINFSKLLLLYCI
jgi:hypothetical protein